MKTREDMVAEGQARRDEDAHREELWRRRRAAFAWRLALGGAIASTVCWALLGAQQRLDSTFMLASWLPGFIAARLMVRWQLGILRGMLVTMALEGLLFAIGALVGAIAAGPMAVIVIGTWPVLGGILGGIADHHDDDTLQI